METNKNNEKCYSVFYKDGDEANDHYLTKREALSLAMSIEEQGYRVIVAKDLGHRWETIYKTESSEQDLPNSWEEFCAQYPYRAGEWRLESNGMICRLSSPSANGKRSATIDKTLLPNKDYAEAVIAFCQLIQLRDCYRQGWKPDYSAGNDQKKFMIGFDRGMLDCFPWGYCAGEHQLFAFQSKEIQLKFFNNFRDLLKEIQPLFQ